MNPLNYCLINGEQLIRNYLEIRDNSSSNEERVHGLACEILRRCDQLSDCHCLTQDNDLIIERANQIVNDLTRQVPELANLHASPLRDPSLIELPSYLKNLLFNNPTENTQNQTPEENLLNIQPNNSSLLFTAPPPLQHSSIEGLLGEPTDDLYDLNLILGVGRNNPSNTGSFILNLQNLLSRSSNDDLQTININFSQLKNNPSLILTELHETLINKNPQAPDIYVVFFNDNGEIQKGIDDGGLSREFMTTLFKALVSTKNDLTFEKTFESGNVIPLLEKVSVPITNQFIAIGRLMGLCLCSNTGMRIGPIFDFSIFQAIHALNQEDLERRTIKTNINTNLKLFEHLNENNKEITSFITVKLLNPSQKKRALEFAFPEDSEEHFHDSDEIIKNAIIKNYNIIEKTAPLLSIAKGLKISIEASGSTWKEMMDVKSALDLYNMIQGIKLSKENIKLNYDEKISSSKRKVFFERWINETSPENLQLLIFASTGSMSAPSDRPLEIDVFSTSENFFDLRTCAKSISIPESLENIDYETFKNNIEHLISLSGYDKA